MKSEVLSVERAGRSIFARRWSPEGAPRGAVQIAHGLAEHSARYERLAQALTAAGYVVTASDHRGHGPNCPPADLGFFADANGWRECLEDLEAVHRRIGADFPGLPRVFLGHSMGSFMGQTFIAEHGADLAGVVLSGTSRPAPGILPIGRRIAGFERWRQGPRGKSPMVQALLFGELNKPFKPARTPFDWLSRDPAEVDKYIADPYCGFEVTNQLAIDLIGALADLASPETAAKIPKGLPIYLFSGARDPVGAKLQGLIDVYRAAGLRATTKIYPEARHETLNETNRDEVTATRSPRIWLTGSTRTSAERASPFRPRQRIPGSQRPRANPHPFSCARMPAMSPIPQCSTIRPSRTRKMSQEVKRRGRPVGPMPK
jgi:alpha-beta hydrolase superfamily lysophospholipase